MQNKKVQTKVRPVPIILIGEYEDFGQGLEDLKTYHAAVENMFLSENPLTLDEAISAVVEALSNNKPSLLNKQNIHYSAFVSSNKVSVRTEDFISFGWDIRYIVQNGKAIIEKVIFKFTILNGDEELRDSFMENGWALIENNR